MFKVVHSVMDVCTSKTFMVLLISVAGDEEVLVIKFMSHGQMLNLNLIGTCYSILVIKQTS